MDNSEKEVIAEYVFSYQTDVLIKSDGLKLVDVLYKHNLVTQPCLWKDKIKAGGDTVAGELFHHLYNIFTVDKLDEIMNNYYAGKL